MSKLIVVYMLLTMVVTFFAALRWRPVVCAAMLACMILAGLAAPFVYFGVLALMSGEPLWETLTQVTVVMPALYGLALYTVVWSAVGLIGGAILRASWLWRKGRLT
ncbi:MAG: hypothetical protein AB8B60_17795 [Sulfitobacter sp.]